MEKLKEITIFEASWLNYVPSSINRDKSYITTVGDLETNLKISKVRAELSLLTSKN